MPKIKVTIEAELEFPEGVKLVSVGDMPDLIQFDGKLLAPELSWCKMEESEQEQGEEDMTFTDLEVSEDEMVFNFLQAVECDIELTED